MGKRMIALVLALWMMAGRAEASVVLAQPQLELSATSAVLMEKETGRILYEQEGHQPLEPASVTKIMTLLLVMEAIDRGQITKEDQVTISAYAAGMGGSQVYLKEGEQMSVEELLKCITVVSGNDAAVAMAEYVAGSESAFVERMNERARALGMENTHFLNCTGLPAAGHQTSAYDIALMSRELIRNHPEIRDYSTIWMDSIRGGTFGLTNTNRLIRFYEGATGLKTGSTDSALYCVSATAERNGMELIAVVMKSPTSADRFEDAKKLLDYGFASYTQMDVPPGQAIPPLEVHLGTRKQLQPQLAYPGRILIPKGKEQEVTTRLTLAENVEAPVEQGQKVGEMEILLDNVVCDTIPILAGEPIDRLTTFEIFLRLGEKLLMAEG